MYSRITSVLTLLCCVTLISCHAHNPEANTVVMVIENSPNNLDLRIGTDAQAEHIGALIFDSLVRKDEHFQLQPWLAESWEQPDARTLIFHLRHGVRFHDGRALTSADVKWTLDSLRNGSIVSAKAANYASIAAIEAPDDFTVVLHLLYPDVMLLWNLGNGTLGIVPRGSGSNLGQHPIGSGPFRFVSQMQDKEVVLERNPDYWQTPPAIERLRFAVVPDTTTRALELQKGSADIASNALTPDMIYSMRNQKNVVIETHTGTVLNYINFNATDPILRDKRVRQAIAYAINRPLIIHALWRDHAQLADTLLPPSHWALAGAGEVASYDYDPAKARSLLDAAGFPVLGNGVRFHLTMKTSTDETARLLAEVVQEQLRTVGIAIDLRSSEFGTFYADITHGSFQMYTLRWVGDNESPAIFRNAYSTGGFSPRGYNRGHYSNPQLDALIAAANKEPDEATRHADYLQIQKIIAEDEPTLMLWYLDNIVVHSRRLTNVHLTQMGTFDFLRSARLQ